MKRNSFYIVLGLAIVTRLAFIWKAPLWYDENFSYLVAQLSFIDMISAIKVDVHPPLFYIIEWFFLRITHQPWALRIPSALFSIWAFYLLARILEISEISLPTQQTTLFFMAFLPFQLWFAQETRMYSMLQAFILLAVFSVYKKNARLLFLSSLAMLYTHNIALLYLPFIFLTGIMKATSHDEYKGVLFPFLFSFLIWLPWLNIVLSQASRIDNEYWIPAFDLLGAFNMIYHTFWLNTIASPWNIFAYFLTLITLLLGISKAVLSQLDDWRIVLLLSFGPILMATLISKLWQPVFMYRQAIGLAPFLYPLVAFSGDFTPPFLSFRSKNMQRYLRVIFMPLLIIGVFTYYASLTDQKINHSLKPYMQGVLPDIMQEWQASDIFIHVSDASIVNTVPYTSNLPHYKITSCDLNKDLSIPTYNILNIKVAHLAEIKMKRAWIIAPIPLRNASCYEIYLTNLLSEEKPFLIIDNNPSALYGVWLHTYDK